MCSGRSGRYAGALVGRAASRRLATKFRRAASRCGVAGFLNRSRSQSAAKCPFLVVCAV